MRTILWQRRFLYGSHPFLGAPVRTPLCQFRFSHIFFVFLGKPAAVRTDQREDLFELRSNFIIEII
jgi:hypothetical protein